MISLPDHILINICGRLSLNDQVVLSETDKRMNTLLHDPTLSLLNAKLLNRISLFTLKVFYSYESKRDEIQYSKDFKYSYLKRNDNEIADILVQIENLFEKKANANSQQYLHEALFLYFIFKDLEKSPNHKYHDNRQPDNMLKLIHLLIDNKADQNVPYKHNGSLVTMRNIGNLWRQLQYKGELKPEQMEGLSPLAFIAKCT